MANKKIGDYDTITPTGGELIEVQTSAPASKNVTVQSIANLANPMTTAGDMIIGASAGAPARFAAPTTGTVWTLTYVVGTGYVWSSEAASSAYDWIIALGDETTAITTGTAKVTVRAPAP